MGALAVHDALDAAALADESGAIAIMLTLSLIPLTIAAYRAMRRFPI